MANVPQPLNEGQDQAARAEATRQSWNALSHLLHLPQFNVNALGTADGASEAAIVRHITDQINSVRRGLRGRAQLGNELMEEYEAARNTAANRLSLDNNLDETERLGLARAEALLAIATGNIGEAEIHALDENARRLLDSLWNASEIPSGTSIKAGGEDIQAIDLFHPTWQTGTADDIRQRLVGQTPDRVGIILRNRGATAAAITDAEVTALFATAPIDILDPAVPTGARLLENVPTIGWDTTFDVSRLIQLDPETATMDESELVPYLKLPANRATFDAVVQCNPSTNTSQAHRYIDAIIAALYRSMGRRAGSTLCGRTVTIGEAIAVRAPVERMVFDSADARELTLALATLRADPSAASVLQAPASQEAHIQDEIRKNQNLLTTSRTVHTLQNTPKLSGSPAQMRERLLALQAYQNYAQKALTAAHGNYNFFNNLSDAQIRFLRQLNLPQFVQRTIIQPSGVGRHATPGQDNRREIEQLMDRSIEEQYKLKDEREKIDVLGRQLNEISDVLQKAHVSIDQLTAANGYPLLEQLLLDTNRTPVEWRLTVDVDQLDASIDPAQIAREVKRALRTAAPANDRVDLKDPDIYEAQDEALLEQLAVAQAAPGHGLRGSEACWEVIKKGLENQGITGEELERTIAHMRQSLLERPAVLRDAESFARAAFNSDGLPDDETEEEWNKRKGPTPYRSLEEYDDFDGLKEYEQRVFPDVVKVRLEQDPWTMRLEDLERAYFNLKFLVNSAPTELRLPRSRTITAKLRRMHAVLLERMVQEFGSATGISDRMLQAALAANPNANAVGFTAKQKLECAQQYLTSDAYMTAERKKELLEDATKAYEPIKQHIEKINALDAANRAHRSIFTRTKDFVTGIHFEKVATPMKYAGRITTGAVIGTVFAPGIGTVIGAVVVPSIWKWVTGNSKSSSHSSSGNH